MYQPLIKFCPHPAIITQVLYIFANDSENHIKKFDAKYPNCFEKIEEIGNGYIVSINLEELWKIKFPNKPFQSIIYDFYNKNLLSSEKIELIPYRKITFQYKWDYFNTLQINSL